MLEIKSNLGNTYVLTEIQTQVIATCFIQQLIIAVSIEHDGVNPDVFVDDMRNNIQIISENCPLPIHVGEWGDPEYEEYVDLETLRNLTEDIKITESLYREFIVWSDKTREMMSGK